MLQETANILITLTSEFYQQQAASFSGTRNNIWPGWRRCLSALCSVAGQEGKPANGTIEESTDKAAFKTTDSLASEAFAAEAQQERDLQIQGNQRIRLLDVGAGNLRFERFLVDEMPDVTWEFTAVDNCAPLVSARNDVPAVRFLEHDVIRAAVAGDLFGEDIAYDYANYEQGAKAETLDLADCSTASHQIECSSNAPMLVDGGSFDAAVCFGFMHHVPGIEARVRMLRGLLEQLRPGGVLVVSFWRFDRSAQLAASARDLLPEACSQVEARFGLESGSFAQDLDAGDYLLGWQNQPGVFRYCHTFSAEEVSRLTESVADLAHVQNRFASDGRTGDMNEYLILRRL